MKQSVNGNGGLFGFLFGSKKSAASSALPEAESARVAKQINRNDTRKTASRQKKAEKKIRKGDDAKSYYEGKADAVAEKTNAYIHNAERDFLDLHNRTKEPAGMDDIKDFLDSMLRHAISDRMTLLIDLVKNQKGGIDIQKSLKEIRDLEILNEQCNQLYEEYNTAQNDYVEAEQDYTNMREAQERAYQQAKEAAAEKKKKRS